jgi:hypothetical protein
MLATLVQLYEFRKYKNNMAEVKIFHVAPPLRATTNKLLEIRILTFVQR